jgi:phosphoserine aminotransferase
VQSYTVIPVEADIELIKKIKSSAWDAGLLLGEGYGEFKTTTFRIANFPALKKVEIRKLMEFLKDY